MNTQNEINQDAISGIELQSNLSVTESGEQQLTADEVHELRQIIENSILVQGELEKSKSVIQDLPITEDDKNRFFDMLLMGENYTEEFQRMNGKIKVKFRSRTRIEEEDILRQIQQDFADNVIKTDGLYVNRLNLYNLLTQTVSIDGVSVVADKNLPLRERADKSIFGSMSEPKIYILSCILTQFENKLSRLCRIALKEDFSTPATDS